VRVGGQPGADGGLAQVLADAPGVDAGDNRPVDRVFDEPGLGAAFGSLDGVGVRVLLAGVADGNLAEVPAGQGMFFQPAGKAVEDLPGI
jgi:hypothetical protein